MPRYVVFLRGVSPLNARMSELKRCFESAGFTNVRTLLGSGNVIFNASSRSETAVERLAEEAMQQSLGHVFYPIARSTKQLHALLDADPFATHRISRDAKRVVTFLRTAPKPRVPLPLSEDGATVIGVRGREILTSYLPSPKGPVFMRLIERALGKDVTTRTWETVVKCARA